MNHNEDPDTYHILGKVLQSPELTKPTEIGNNGFNLTVDIIIHDYRANSWYIYLRRVGVSKRFYYGISARNLVL